MTALVPIGAGPKVKALFEQAHPQCQVNYVPFNSTGTLFNRVRLEGKKTKADIVLGLDSTMLDEAKKTQLFAPNKVATDKLSLPVKWQDNVFYPMISVRMPLCIVKTNCQIRQKV